MAKASDFPIGSKVRFRPSPRSSNDVVAEVVGHVAAKGGRGGGEYLQTKDSAGVERRARPGACEPA